MSLKSWYGRYSFIDLTEDEATLRHLWSCDGGMSRLPGCGAIGEGDSIDDACWAAHDHERVVHGRALYPRERLPQLDSNQ